MVFLVIKDLLATRGIRESMAVRGLLASQVN